MSEVKLQKQARLAARFWIHVAKFGEMMLSVDRAADFSSLQNDGFAKAHRSRREASAQRARGIVDAKIRRELDREMRNSERAIDRFWRRFKCKVRKEPRPAAPSSTKATSVTLASSARGAIRRGPRGIKLPSYSGPVVDRAGRRGVYMDVQYYGARRSRVGIAGAMIKYITRPDGVEYLDGDDRLEPSIISNVGETPEEQIAAFDLVETLSRSARDNAKVVFTMVVNLPHDVDPATRREIMQQFCDDAFGAHDLPFCAAVHEPSGEGDQRNKHGHVVFALRPMQRVGDHEWLGGQAIRSEFDNADHFKFFRRLFAETMTEVVQKAGKRRTYTHLTNVERGLKMQPLEKLGKAKTAAFRRGESVPAVERNRALVAENEFNLSADRSRVRLRKLGETIGNAEAVVRGLARLAAIKPYPIGAGNTAAAVGSTAYPIQSSFGFLRSDLFAEQDAPLHSIFADTAGPAKSTGSAIRANAFRQMEPQSRSIDPDNISLAMRAREERMLKRQNQKRGQLRNLGLDNGLDV